MASTNQNFIKWEQDTFIIQFTITDADIELSNYLGYWAMSPATASLAPSYVDSNSTRVLTKDTIKLNQAGDYGQGGGIAYSPFNKFRVSIAYDDTQNFTAQDYYHELTLAESDRTDSVVVASGIFTLRFPLFPSNFRQ
jgi:hypothetical protein